MTIRSTLLISYIIITLLSALLFSLMVFVHLRDTLHVNTENMLKAQAASLIHHIDSELFERMKDLVLWQRLEVMQDLHTRDVDKRLAQFFHELSAGYGGVYGQLFATDNQQQIIAASSPDMIGQIYPTLPDWQIIDFNQHRIAVKAIERTPEFLYLSITLPDAFTRETLGILYAGLEWSEIIRQMTTPLAEVHTNALLLDHNNRILAMLGNFGDRFKRFQQWPGHWPQFTQAKGAFTLSADEEPFPTQLAGYARSKGYLTFPGFGWTMVVFQPEAYELSKITRLWGVLLLFLGLTLLLGMALAWWMSKRLARPIVQLAGFTREFMTGRAVTFPDIHADGEIGELSDQFGAMIAHLEQSRRDVVRATKLAVVGEMAASLAHEVRTPLGILQSSAQLLQREPNLSDVGQEMIGFILTETRRMNQLVTLLLECARPRPPNYQRHDLADIIEHTLNLLKTKADSKGVTLTMTCPDRPISIMCDKDHLTQLFLNLIMNALQHITPDGEIQVIVQAQDECWHCQVCDTGPGIADDLKERIFEPFYTGREQGIGLGLTVVQQIVLAHHGQIQVTDHQPTGACFVMTLPMQQTESER
ncbi:MAG: sensor histidine kinase [Methylococcales bacterium]|nr:sensor histidine kinase [Methylococcales bacterium]